VYGALRLDWLVFAALSTDGQYGTNETVAHLDFQVNFSNLLTLNFIG